jgi:bacterioferritin-associated ferredoxin
MTPTERELDHVFEPEADDDVLVCRCEEITKGEIRRAVYDGIFTMTEMRRYLRAGMGLCQGQSCGRNVKALISKERKIPSASLDGPMARSPMRPVEMIVLGSDKVGF